MLDFVTIIRFEDVFYPYQNQGLSVIFSWIFLDEYHHCYRSLRDWLAPAMAEKAGIKAPSQG